MKNIHKEIINSLNSQIKEYEDLMATCSTDYERRYLKGAINAVKVDIAKIDCLFVGKENS